ncbi:MAG: oligosaccharide flippase family protein, partial [Gammaproteobacteria bacterium]
GFGVWALILQMVSASFLAAFFYWRLGLWRPSLRFSFRSLGELFGFGGYLLLEAISAVPFRNMYVIVIAKFFTAAVAGLYYFADKIKEIVMIQFVQSIQNVTYPALAMLQEDDARLKLGFRKVIAVTTFLLFPAMIFLAALADPLFAAVLPEKWRDAVVFLQLMCLAGLLNPMNSINLNILKVKGRSDIVLYVGFYKKAVAIGIFIFTLQYGIIAILLGQIVNSVLAYIPNSYFSARLIDYTVKEQAADFAPALLLSAAIALLAYGLQSWVEWAAAIELSVFGLLAAVLYVLGAHLLKLRAYQLVRELLQSRLAVNIARRQQA